jgi:hypothetical protein
MQQDKIEKGLYVGSELAPPLRYAMRSQYYNPIYAGLYMQPIRNEKGLHVGAELAPPLRYGLLSQKHNRTLAGLFMQHNIL